MRRLRQFAGLWRSTPVRLALGLVLLFSVVSLATLGFAYLHLRGSIKGQIEGSLDALLADFRVIDNPETLAALVAVEAAATDPRNRIFVFIGPDGASVGNAAAELHGAQVRLMRREGGRRLDEDDYETRVAPMAGGVMIVAESRAPLKEPEETFVRLIGLSLIPTILVSLSVGVWLALVSARRVRRIEGALDRLAEGDLAARVAETGRADDLARIGDGIDRMATAQQAATAVLRQVSTDIAHDLKTPVQRIAVLLSDLRDRLPEDGPESAIAERAALEAERAVAVFQSLLQIAQIEGGSPRARFKPVDLGEILRTFAEIYGPAAEDADHVLHLAPLPQGPLTVPGDKGLLGQVVANLIENALRHTPAGSRIDLALVRDGGRLVLSVADTGPGIPENARALVLRRLYRLERSRTTPGHGLGLSLVAAIADLHGAALALSDNAPGLRVRLSFPAAPT
ncbi:MAG: two-component sensor histidine kinase [Alphaproteobacteria bacterium HGW-Alphaproteobacteria-8]|nr:MAG: two-component sensor histidine kinase [Alphaproteobacteria bacterium HGW-Alphaproteobacteria-8]